jgi:uncharacterized protein (DUF305 family)
MPIGRTDHHTLGARRTTRRGIAPLDDSEITVKQTTIRTRAVPVAVAAIVTAILAACGATDAPTAAGPASSAGAATSAAPTSAAATPSNLPTVAVPPAKGPHNDIDSVFSTDMLPHHRQAVEMAALARTRAADPRIKDIASRIEKAQGAEVTLMASWLKAWGEPVPAPDELHTAHGPGMMTHAEMEDLKGAEGAEFDRMFADMMIRHHQGALEMAGITKEQGQNPSVRALATNVVITQTAEVAELTDILESL